MLTGDNDCHTYLLKPSKKSGHIWSFDKKAAQMKSDI